MKCWPRLMRCGAPVNVCNCKYVVCSAVTGSDQYGWMELMLWTQIVVYFDNTFTFTWVRVCLTRMPPRHRPQLRHGSLRHRSRRHRSRRHRHRPRLRPLLRPHNIPCLGLKSGHTVLNWILMQVFIAV